MNQHPNIPYFDSKAITLGMMYDGVVLVNQDNVKKVRLKELSEDEKRNIIPDMLKFNEKVEGRNK